MASPHSVASTRVLSRSWCNTLLSSLLWIPLAPHIPSPFCRVSSQYPETHFPWYPQVPTPTRTLEAFPTRQDTHSHYTLKNQRKQKPRNQTPTQQRQDQLAAPRIPHYCIRYLNSVSEEEKWFLHSILITHTIISYYFKVMFCFTEVVKPSVTSSLMWPTFHNLEFCVTKEKWIKFTACHAVCISRKYCF